MMSNCQNHYHFKNFTMQNNILKGIECPFMEAEIYNFGEFLLNKMKIYRKLTAQIDILTKEEDTYASMINKSIKCAKWLKSQNIGSGDIVGICTHNHCNQIIPALAALYIEAIFNPWCDHGLNKDGAKYFINLTRPKVLFTSEAYAKIASDASSEINPDMKIVVFGNIPEFESFENIINPSPSDLLELEIQNFKCAKFDHGDVPAAILYTSGSTGLPKGALLSHKSLYGNSRFFDNFQNHNFRRLWYSTLGWASGVLSSFSTIWYGGIRYISGPFDAENFCRTIQNHHIDRITLGTSMANRILKSKLIPNCNVMSVTSVHVGGAPLRKDSFNQLCREFPNANVLEVYGSTELGGVVTVLTKKMKENSVGFIGRNCQLKIIDPQSGSTLGPNERGEICIKSPFRMLRYWENPEKTNEAIDSEGWCHTGDMGYYDKNGEIFLIDRLKELIKWQGHHVPPSVIEKVIQTLPEVLEVAVVGVPDYEDDERPMAFVVKSPASNVTEQNIHQLVDQNLPDQMKLRAGVKFIDQIPHTTSSKVSRLELKTMAKIYSRQ